MAGIKEYRTIEQTSAIEYDEKKLDLKDLDKFVEKAGFKSLGINTFEKERQREGKPIV